MPNPESEQNTSGRTQFQTQIVFLFFFFIIVIKSWFDTSGEHKKLVESDQINSGTDG